MPDTPPTTSSTRTDAHPIEAREDLVDATRRKVAASEDILAFVQRIKEGQERDREELSSANHGRRTHVSNDYDRDGNQYEGRHTSLSPLTRVTSLADCQ
jgi:hypothetical protein